MFRHLRSVALRHVALALYALAMLTVGVAHRPIRDAGPADESAYTLPDGTAPVICTSKLPGGSMPSHVAHCEACCLVAAPGLPPSPAAAETPPPAVTAIRWERVEDRQGLLAAMRAFQARGPPSA